MAGGLEKVPVAGVASVREPDSPRASDCFKFPAAAAVPDHVAKYRRSSVPPGQRILHPGLRDDFRALDESSVTFGAVKGQTAETFASERKDWLQPKAHLCLAVEAWALVGRKKETCLACPAQLPQPPYLVSHHAAASPPWQVPSEVDAAKQQAAEAVYHSRRREVLGKGFTRGHKLPQSPKYAQGFVFGKSSGAGSGDDRGGFASKALIYPSPEAEDPKHRRMYEKSHRSCPPQAQVKRDYQWPESLNPETHLFGTGSGSHTHFNNSSHHIQDCLQHLYDDLPKVKNWRAEEARALQDQVGRGRSLLQKPADPAHVYGFTHRQIDDWDARACIEGQYAPQELEAELDLGRSLTPGFRNDPALTRGDLDQSHAFGAPTVKKRPGKQRGPRSLADNGSYGDGVNASILLRPSVLNEFLGVTPEDFTQLRNKDYLFNLFTAAKATDNQAGLKHEGGALPQCSGGV
mmetsp:Transcript_2522/g.7396  ORF Transcript_2522/g.7396 Transcript_2522/m.7396 type:complete len:462 (-) Transcript_2522:578-1963(-)